jgi:cytosine/adenosine deaminase-related metal-dependent hydrolase
MEMMKRVLIKCGWLVTLDPAIGDFKGGEILFQGNRIEAVGKNLNAAADETIDATDKIVMPGLVNAHMHTWETALRGIGVEWTTPDYLKHMHLNLATRYNAEDNYLGNLLGALAQIDAGVTTLVDWCHNITSLEMAERAVDGLVDSGIRAVFAHGTAKPPTKEGGVPFTHVPHPRDRIEALRKGRLASDDGRVTLAMAILGPDWGAWEVVEHDIRMAREFGLVSSSHTRPREHCVVPDGYARMAKEGLLGADHNLVHGTTYTHADLKLIVDNGASLTSTVLVELHHHIGDAQVAAFREAGGLPSLGIDVEPFCSGHMFREMQAALLFARGKEIRNNALRGNSPLKELPVRSREALEWATIGGARAFLMEDSIGTLTPGKKADIVMLRANDINMAPVYDPIFSIVEIAGAGNVDTVIIDGIVRKKDGKLTIPADVLSRRLAELAASGERILKEAGYRVETAPH